MSVIGLVVEREHFSSPDIHTLGAFLGDAVFTSDFIFTHSMLVLHPNYFGQFSIVVAILISYEILIMLPYDLSLRSA